jgi:hypothetical protein
VCVRCWAASILTAPQDMSVHKAAVGQTSESKDVGLGEVEGRSSRVPSVTADEGSCGGDAT